MLNVRNVGIGQPNGRGVVQYDGNDAMSLTSMRNMKRGRPENSLPCRALETEIMRRYTK